MSNVRPLTHINHIEELSQKEKDRLLGLIINRLGLDIVYYKLDINEERTVELMTRQSI